MIKTAKFLTPILAPALAATLALGAAVPASAASVNVRHAPMSEISRIDRQIDRALLTRTISRAEAAMFECKVDHLRQTYRKFSRGGFDRFELRTLDREIGSVELQLQREIDRNAARFSGKRGVTQDHGGNRDHDHRTYRR